MISEKINNRCDTDAKTNYRKKKRAKLRDKFIDYTKAFDKICRSELWDILEGKGFPKYLIKVIKNMSSRNKFNY